LCCAALVAVAAVGVRSAPSRPPVTVCHAGSVGAALAEIEKSFAVAHPDVVVSDVSGGSVALARRLASGAQNCDVYASADYLDIDRMLKPAGLADYSVMFAHGAMVLAYLVTDPRTQGIAAAGEFRPPSSIPDAALDWYRQLLAPGVRIGGAHPFLDPGGYRADIILQLTQRQYGVANLYNALLEHYEVVPAATGAGAAAPTLGREFSFQFIYEHSAAAAANWDSAYRYVRLPNAVNLSDAAHAASYAEASVTMPGLGIAGAAASVTIPGARAIWGVTIPRNAVNRDGALAFVAMMLGPIGTTALNASGLSPIMPPLVSRGDYGRIPPMLRPLVKPTSTAP
jgi:molybdate/tungstate transport system substrate-binding protein